MLPATDETRALERAYYETGRALRALSGGGPMGLTPDSVRASDEWRAAKAAYDRAFSALRAHNAMRAKGKPKNSR